MGFWSPRRGDIVATTWHHPMERALILATTTWHGIGHDMAASSMQKPKFPGLLPLFKGCDG